MRHCPYCQKPNQFETGYHDCPGAQDAKARIEGVIDAIERNFRRPFGEPVTSMQLKARADNRRHLAQAIRIKGGKVQEPYNE